MYSNIREDISIDQFRYFRDLKTGKITKLTNEEIKKRLFGNKLCQIGNLTEYIDFKGKEPPNQYVPIPIPDFTESIDEPLDLKKYINNLPPLIIKKSADRFGPFIYFDKGDYFFLNRELESRMNADTPYWDDEGIITFRQHNEKKWKMVTEKEKIEPNIIGEYIEDTKNLIPTTNERRKITSIHHFTSSISFLMQVNKGDILYPKDPFIAQLIFNQSFLRFMHQNEEILGKEKEEIYNSEYKDNIPGTTIRYYRIRDEFVDKIVKFDLENDSSVIVDPKEKIDGICHPDGYIRFTFCRFNKNNFDGEGNPRYVYYEYIEPLDDMVIEEQILKIATRLPKEEALKHYKKDLEGYEKMEECLRAEEYIRTHKNKYNKGKNRLLTPVEFMRQEEQIERKNLGMRLVKTLNKRIKDINER